MKVVTKTNLSELPRNILYLHKMLSWWRAKKESIFRYLLDVVTSSPNFLSIDGRHLSQPRFRGLLGFQDGGCTEISRHLEKREDPGN